MIEVAHEHEAFRAIEKQELVLSLHKELAAMPEQLRTPLVLFHLDGKTRVEVAEQLDTTVEAIKSRLARARTKLRARLTRRGVGLSLSIAAATAFTFDNKEAQAALVEQTIQLCLSKPGIRPASLRNHDSINNLAHEGAKNMSSALVGKTIAFAVVLLLLVGGLSVAPGHSSDLDQTVLTLSNDETLQTETTPSTTNFVSITSSEDRNMISKAAKDKAIQAIIKALRDDSLTIRTRAARTLGEIGAESTEAIDALVESCKNPVDGELSDVNLRAIGYVINESDYAYNILIGLLNSKEHRHLGWKMASHAALRKTDELVNAALAVLDSDDNEQVRVLAMNRLCYITAPPRE